VKTKCKEDADEDKKLDPHRHEDRPQHNAAGIMELTKDIHGDKEHKHRRKIALDDPLDQLRTAGDALQRILQPPDPTAYPDQNKGDQRAPVIRDEHSGPAAQLRHHQK